MKNHRAIFVYFVISTLNFLPLSGQEMSAPSHLTPAYQELSVNSIKEELKADTPEVNQRILEHIFLCSQENAEDDVLRELVKGLTTDELKKLYKVLTEAIDHPWTEGFAEKLWQALSLKIKLESPVFFGNPRIYLIAVMSGERHFVMMLSDGSIWEVADHLSGDPSLDLIIIRDLLGQYTEVDLLQTYENFSYQITTLGFPEIRFNGKMLANKISSLILEDKDLYWFGVLHN